MSIQKHFTVVSFFLLVFSQNLFSQIILQGTVTDNGGEYLGNGAEPVVSALVTVTDQADTTRSFSGYTNEQGEYSFVIWATGVGDNNPVNPGRFNLLQNYPNPFNPSTIIGYELTKPTNISIEIYDVLGRKIKTLFDGFQSNRVGQIVWDATNDLGQGVPAGVYVYSLKAEGIRINKKMLLLDGHRGSSNISLAQSKGTNVSSQAVLGKQMSDQYLLQVTGDEFETHEQQNLEIAGNMTLDITVTRTVTDIDGNVYPTVKIGDQWWMAENLKVTYYRTGDPIPNITGDTDWGNLTLGAYCNHENDERYSATYGCFYNWYAVNDSRNIAPTGWRVPTRNEWQTLIDYLGGEGVAGGKMKESGTSHWNSPNSGATNESGFSALPGGYRRKKGDFSDLGYNACFWSATEHYSDYAFQQVLYHNSSHLDEFPIYKQFGYSVRCVKEDTTTPTLIQITIAPEKITIKNGESQQFTCIVKYSDGSEQNVSSSATWSVSPGTAGSISSSGLFTADSSATGMEAVRSSYDGQEASATVTVASELETVTDIDGNVYLTVKIGDQWWMAENLKVTHYRNGNPIPNVTSDFDWPHLTTGAYCNHENDERYVATYGRLYNWYAVDDIRGIAPEGWHVPSDDEWKELEMYLGMSQADAYTTGWRGTGEGGKLKETGTSHWLSPNTGATNESGFSALAGGCRRGSNGLFDNMGEYAYFWSSTHRYSDYAWYRCLSYKSPRMDHLGYYKLGGLSVRCVKDE